MRNISKSLSLLSIAILAISCTFRANPVNAQSSTQSSVPQFRLQYVDNSYDVPPKPTSSTDPYTGKTTTTTIPGYHVENKTIEAVIENNIGASYYNFRYKGHYTGKWSSFPFNPESGSGGYSLADSYSVPCQASSTSETVISLNFLPQHIPVDGQVDVQVQALFGNFDAIPYGHIMPLPAPTYDFIFKGETGDWSITQIIIITDTSASMSPSPTVPEFPPLVILPLLLYSVLPFLAVKLFRNRQSGKSAGSTALIKKEF